ncbi:hypothetical protein ACUNWD_05085 [Sunxiuqinia sp. A32]|uniref:hypothetical protein n=1 Tax=Sunxiuqinia sp. A32 TaxID=3461496 RepID=UPI004045773D
MNNIFKIFLGIFLVVYGLYSIYGGIRGKSLRGVMAPGDTYLSRKFLGEKGSNIFWNLFWGTAELVFGILILLGKFD